MFCPCLLKLSGYHHPPRSWQLSLMTHRRLGCFDSCVSFILHIFLVARSKGYAFLLLLSHMLIWIFSLWQVCLKMNFFRFYKKNSLFFFFFNNLVLCFLMYHFPTLHFVLQWTFIRNWSLGSISFSMSLTVFSWMGIFLHLYKYYFSCC